MIYLDACRGLNHIGRLGENEHRTLRFRESAEILAMYPDATVTVLHKRPGDAAAYPVAPGYVSIEGGTVCWTIQSGDLATVGRGQAEVVFTSGGVIAKSLIYDTMIDRALDGAGDPPEPWESWIEDVAAEAERAEAAAEDAVEAATGRDKNGNPVQPGNPHYENNAYYGAEQSKLWAIEKDLSGNDAPNGSPQKNNSAKHWAEEAHNAVDSFNEHLVETVDSWLEENITNPSSPPLDRSLSLNSAAAPADMVGDISNAVFLDADSTGNMCVLNGLPTGYVVGVETDNSASVLYHTKKNLVNIFNRTRGSMSGWSNATARNFNINNYYDGFDSIGQYNGNGYSSVTYIDGGIQIDKGASGGGGGNGSLFPVQLAPGTYTISANILGTLRILIYNSAKKYSTYMTALDSTSEAKDKSYTFTVPSGTTWVGLEFNNHATKSYQCKNLQIEYSSTASAYEGYQGEVLAPGFKQILAYGTLDCIWTDSGSVTVESLSDSRIAAIEMRLAKGKIAKVYNTVADMVSAVESFLPGDYVSTNGYYSAYDGGAAHYLIIAGTASTMDVDLGSGLMAKFVEADDRFLAGGGKYGSSVNDTQKARNTTVINAMLGLWKAFDGRGNTIATLNWSRTVDGGERITNCVFHLYADTSVPYAIGRTSGVEYVKLENLRFVNQGSTNITYCVKIGDSSSINGYASNSTFNDLIFDGFTYPMVLRAWWTGLGRISFKNCTFGGVFYGTSLDFKELGVSSCLYGCCFGIMLDTNGDPVTGDNDYLVYSRVGIYTGDHPSSDSVPHTLVGLVTGWARYLSIGTFAYETGERVDVAIGHYNRNRLEISIGTIFTYGHFAEKFFEWKVTPYTNSNTGREERFTLIVNNMYGDYLTSNFLDSEGLNLVTQNNLSLYQDNQQAIKNETAHVFDEERMECNVGMTRFLRSDIMSFAEGSARNVAKRYYCKDQFFGTLKKGKKLTIRLFGSIVPLHSGDTAYSDFQHTPFLAKVMVGTCYGTDEIFGETMIGLHLTSYTQGTDYSSALHISSPITGLNITIDSTGNAPVIVFEISGSDSNTQCLVDLRFFAGAHYFANISDVS